MSTLKVNTIQKRSGSALAIGESGDTVTITGTTTNIVGTLQNNGASVGGSNTPVFAVTLSGNQSIPDASVTKVTFDTESIDSDGAFASNKFTVPSGKSGKYWFSTGLGVDAGGVGSFRNANVHIYKNGSSVKQSYFHNDNASAYTTKFFVWNAAVLDLAVSDYIEIYVYHDNAGGTPILTGGTDGSSFYGYKLI